MKDKINIVDNSDILAAFGALDSLWKIRGQARNRRLEILEEHKGNLALKNLFTLAYDFTHSFQVSVPDQMMGRNPAPSHEQNYHEFLLLADALIHRKVSGLRAYRKCVTFLRENCGPLEAKVYHRVLERDLQCGVSLRLTGMIWPELDLEFSLPATSIQKAGMRVYFIIRNGHQVCYSDGFREYPFFEATFGSQLLRASSDDRIYEAWISALDWEFTEAVLHSKTKSLPKRAWKDAFYGINCILLGNYPLSALRSKAPTLDIDFRLIEVYQRIKENNPRTQIQLLSADGV